MNKKQYVLTVALAVVAGLLGGVVSSFLFMGTPVFAQKTEIPEVIRAKSFEVVDKDGKRRAALGMVFGEPSLALFDKNDKRRALLSLLDGEPGLYLYDKNEQPRAALGMDGGEPGLWLKDKNNKLRAALGRAELEVMKTGETRQRPAGSLVLFDKDGNVIWSAP